MKITRVTRRRFLLGALFAAPLATLADSNWLEPKWLKVRRVSLTRQKPAHRLVHITDVHHKGDRAYFQSVVKIINRFSPDLVCFTGDLIEEPQYLPEALEFLAQIKAPLYGVPGNHDYWSKAPFEPITRCLASSGGAWLLDQNVVTQDAKFNIIGAACLSSRQPPLSLIPGMRNIFLMHYPAWVKKLGPANYDLILAGHSHGGQVRIPFFGPISLPFGVEEYDLGLFKTPAGPLYVNPGIGWYPWPIRFNCRPEITVFEI